MYIQRVEEKTGGKTFFLYLVGKLRYRTKWSEFFNKNQGIKWGLKENLYKNAFK